MIPRRKNANRVYKQYVKPLEPSHRGEYVVVTPDGQTIFGPTLLAAVQQAQEISPKDNFIFKVGDKVLGKVL